MPPTSDRAKEILSGKTGARPAEPTSAKPTAAKPAEPAWRQKPTQLGDAPAGISATELMSLEFAPPKFLVQDLLAEGLTILAGKPKHGKSWLALLLGWAVAAGESVDGRSVEGGEVLYLALEDTRRRLQNRIAKLRESLGWVVPERLTLQTAWPRANDGGLYHLYEWLDRNKSSAKLVIIDTLAKFRTPPKGNANGYADDYSAMGDLKQLLDHYGVGGLCLHHTRKLKSEDPFDEVSGTLAITGAADSIWMLDTQQKGQDARLYVTGRDLADATVPMKFGADSGRWMLGASQDGIDTTGRNDAGGKAVSTTKIEQCKEWLLEFLREFAYPSEEIMTAGKAAGFAPSTVRDAKVALGKRGSNQVVHQNFGGDKNNDWWSGVGPSAFWKRRPTPGPSHG